MGEWYSDDGAASTVAAMRGTGSEKPANVDVNHPGSALTGPPRVAEAYP